MLEALAKLLSEAVPLERTRMEQRPYQTDYGTRLRFRDSRQSETNYEPGDWSKGDRTPLRPLLSGQSMSVRDKLAERQELRQRHHGCTQRGVPCLAMPRTSGGHSGWIKLKLPREGFTGWPLELPAGERLVVRSDILPDVGVWLAWCRCAADFPRLVKPTAVMEWIASESPHPLQGASVDDSDLDRGFMERAVEEARKSTAEDKRVHPKVGVVVVNDGRELASAHRGELDKGEHAEFTALERKLKDVEIAGATVYATLEPCTTRNHPKLPCVVRLIERKVRRVVIGMLDPNPRISGKGFHKLREANITVELFPSDLMSRIEEMNREFIRHHKAASELASPESGDAGSSLRSSRPAASPRSGDWPVF